MHEFAFLVSPREADNIFIELSLKKVKLQPKQVKLGYERLRVDHLLRRQRGFSHMHITPSSCHLGPVYMEGGCPG